MKGPTCRTPYSVGEEPCHVSLIAVSPAAPQGSLKKGEYLLNVNSGKKVKIPRLVRMHSNEMVDIPEVSAGDVIAIFGVECRCAPDARVSFVCAPSHLPHFDYPPSSLSRCLAVALFLYLCRSRSLILSSLAPSLPLSLPLLRVSAASSMDSFTDGTVKLAMTSMFVPNPVMSLAVRPKSSDAIDRVSGGAPSPRARTNAASSDRSDAAPRD